MMSKEVFIKCFHKLMAAFGKRFVADFSLSEQHIRAVGEIWYEHLSEYPDDVFQTVVNDWVKNQNNPPTIHDLRKNCDASLQIREQMTGLQ